MQHAAATSSCNSRYSAIRPRTTAADAPRPPPAAGVEACGLSAAACAAVARWFSSLLGCEAAEKSRSDTQPSWPPSRLELPPSCGMERVALPQSAAVGAARLAIVCAFAFTYPMMIFLCRMHIGAITARRARLRFSLWYP